MTTVNITSLGIVGPQGVAGLGIANTQIDGGYFYVGYTDGTTANVGYVGDPLAIEALAGNTISQASNAAALANSVSATAVLQLAQINSVSNGIQAANTNIQGQVTTANVVLTQIQSGLLLGNSLVAQAQTVSNSVISANASIQNGIVLATSLLSQAEATSNSVTAANATIQNNIVTASTLAAQVQGMSNGVLAANAAIQAEATLATTLLAQASAAANTATGVANALGNSILPSGAAYRPLDPSTGYKFGVFDANSASPMLIDAAGLIHGTITMAQQALSVPANTVTTAMLATSVQQALIPTGTAFRALDPSTGYKFGVFDANSASPFIIDSAGLIHGTITTSQTTLGVANGSITPAMLSPAVSTALPPTGTTYSRLDPSTGYAFGIFDSNLASPFLIDSGGLIHGRITNAAQADLVNDYRTQYSVEGYSDANGNWQFRSYNVANGMLTALTAGQLTGTNSEPQLRADGTLLFRNTANSTSNQFAVTVTGGTVRLAYSSANVVCLGDSMTYGTGSPTGESYPDDLRTDLGRTVINAGLNGQLSQQIAARAGAITVPLTVANSTVVSGPNQISTINGLPVVAAPAWAALGNLQWLSRGDSLAEVDDTGTFTVANSAVSFHASVARTANATNETYTFTTDAGTPLPISAPNGLIYQSDNANTYLNETLIIWVGRNDMTYGGSGPVFNASIMANIQAIVSAIKPYNPHYIVMPPALGRGIGEQLGTVRNAYWQTLCQDMAAQFGSHFYNLPAAMTSTAALEAAGITPTAQDLSDIANGTVSTSFAAAAPQNGAGATDPIHWNSNANIVAAQYINAIIKQRNI